MNSRERFICTLQFKEVDRPPFCEFLGYWGETVNRWYGEGLPPEVGAVTVAGQPPIAVVIGVSTSEDIFDYFGFDDVAAMPNDLRLDFGPIPRLVPKTLEETERHKIYVDEVGITKKGLKKGVSIPGFIEFPVKTPEDLERLKPRYDPHEPRRYPLNWSDEYADELRTTDHLVTLLVPGFYGQARNFMGFKNLTISFFKNPEFIHSMMNWWTDFIVETMREAVESTKVDLLYVWEDMCYKNGPHISPKLFREFMLPCYKRLTEFFRNNGGEIVAVDTDGNHDLLTDLFIEGGVNCMLPLEVGAGMDALAMQEKYGKRVSMIGNIDKKALAKGKDAIDIEVSSKVPALIERGGYIPSVDHVVPEDVPFENYVYYLKVLKKYLGVA